MCTSKTMVTRENHSLMCLKVIIRPCGNYLTFKKNTTVLSQWDFPHGKFGLLPPGKASCDRIALPKLLCMLGVLVFHNPPNSDMDYRIFNVRTDVNACVCTQGCTDTRKRVCNERSLWVKNHLPHRGIEPASAA